MTKPVIGKNCNIANTAKINENVIIEDNVTIGDFCVIGFNNKRLNKKLIIGKKFYNKFSYNYLFRFRSW